MTSAVHLPGLPFALSPSAGSAWEVDGTTVRATAPARSDLFIHPARVSAPVLDAPMLTGAPPEGDFQFSARVTVGFGADFDAGVLLLWCDEQHWAKLCFEYSPDREPMAVSVVTRGTSDDANGFTVEGNTVWLRVSRVDGAYAYHAATDGKTWRLVRHFGLDAPGPVALGFEVQSPVGDGCTAVFDEVAFSPERLRDLRDGS
ncbi:hypothetical protein Cs7R123_15310 [Catellatospora sp. TT07R-123]|uniref:DUF1349 domain-containing protein n=1 Tax=Catellatospora sp. TT07R-123 TaxID=2733863 RepID=UPI001B0D34C2|nr:DUF1349 domain-containing protein [Catellatospora sp. TT07R-123]GHJ44189.1 hypothetical protein Cs7R123_15310 [Catellatospora sp. TT07R-123]